MSTKNLSSACSLSVWVRLIFAISISFGFFSMNLMHTATISLAGDLLTGGKDDFSGESQRQMLEIEKQKARLSELELQVERMESINFKHDSRLSQLAFTLGTKMSALEAEPGKNNNNDWKELQTLRRQVEENKQDVESTQKALQELLDESIAEFQLSRDNIADVTRRIHTLRAQVPVPPAKNLKLHFWDDSTDYSPREDILMNEGWLEYNGKALGDKNDSTTSPWFVTTDDPWDADIIVWITVMANHEAEIPPTHPMKHAHKVIVLDYADGLVIHKTRPQMMGNHTEIGYFKRSFIHHGPNNTFDENITEYEGVKDILPYAYCGSKAMLLAPDTPKASLNFQVEYDSTAAVYGRIAKTATTEITNKKENDGYFNDQRYKNFLVPFRDRRFTLVNVIKYKEGGLNVDRNRIFRWTHEFSGQKAGDPQNASVVQEELESLPPNERNATGTGFAAYVGEVEPDCEGYCFGLNYLRHLRDCKIIVTCNPSDWEGDFRLWESFLSGALVFVDKMFILNWMPNPPIDGKHWVTYDPGNKTDFMMKLDYYSDPANIAEAEAIAHRGYEHALRHHMPVNRVDYVLNHDLVRKELLKHVVDTSKRAIFGYPSQ